MSDAKPAEGGAEKPAGGGASKGPMLIALVNTVVILSAIGMLTYTRLLFKRTPITEEGERQRLAKIKEEPKPPTTPGMLVFDPMTANIEAAPVPIRTADGTSTQLQGKLHYVYMGFTLEIKDSNRKDELENLRPVILDKLLGLLGRKKFHELSTVQGRYVLRTQMIDMINDLFTRKPASKDLSEKVERELVATNVFFTNFTVQ